MCHGVGVPWYSVMGYHEEALKVQWDSHERAFSVIGDLEGVLEGSSID